MDHSIENHSPKVSLLAKHLTESADLNQRLLAQLQGDVPLDTKQLAQVEQTVNELQISVASAVIRLALCSDELVARTLANISQWPLIDKVAGCPSVVDVLASIEASALSLDWCIEQGVFIDGNQDAGYQLYVGDLYNLFALSVIDASLTNVKQCFLLTPAMLSSYTDELLRERAVSDLFGSAQLNASALAEEAPVINLVNSFLEKAVQADASDIHVESGRQHMIVRFRVDGTLVEYMQQPMSRFPAIASRIKLLSDLDIAERRLPQDGRFTTRHMGKEFDIRVSTAPDVHGESIVMRLLPKEREALNLANLGFEEDHLELIQQWGRLPNGIVLVTGPTGSGKSTTLYGLLADIRSGTEKIVTVEDPVEFQVEGVTQVQARPDIGYTFARALRTFLRQDPDVIMVGEIRDKETADIAVQSSLTGHLVLSTLHTNDACSVFPRLSDIGVERFLIAATVQGVQAQRLVKKLCTHCSEPAPAPTFLNLSTEQDNWRRPVGCEKCHGRGYRGRIGIYELVPVTADLRALITQGADVNKIRKQARKDGARDVMHDGLIKASKGITSVEEVLRVCSGEDDE